MTENEAIKIIGEVSVSLNSKATLTEIRNAYDVVKKAIEELAQLKSEYNRVLKFNDRQGKIIDEYEAIGTVEECREAVEQYDNINSVAKSVALSGLCDFGTAKEGIISEIKSAYKHSLKEYESIGTIEEFKALKEKSEPKKVVPRHIRKYDGFDDGECPTCGNSVLRDGFSNDVYCDDCGQKLDWSE